MSKLGSSFWIRSLMSGSTFKTKKTKIAEIFRSRSRSRLRFYLDFRFFGFSVTTPGFFGFDKISIFFLSMTFCLGAKDQGGASVINIIGCKLYVWLQEATAGHFKGHAKISRPLILSLDNISNEYV